MYTEVRGSQLGVSLPRMAGQITGRDSPIGGCRGTEPQMGELPGVTLLSPLLGQSVSFHGNTETPRPSLVSVIFLVAVNNVYVMAAPVCV